MYAWRGEAKFRCCYSFGHFSFSFLSIGSFHDADYLAISLFLYIHTSGILTIQDGLTHVAVFSLPKSSFWQREVLGHSHTNDLHANHPRLKVWLVVPDWLVFGTFQREGDQSLRAAEQNAVGTLAAANLYFSP